MSTKFRFRLDPVLEQRSRVERERAADHARAVKDLRAAEKQRDDLLAKRETLRERLVREHASFDVETLKATYTHLDYLDRALVPAHQRVAQCVAAAERTRLRLVDAAKDRKVLETLKERRREAFDLDVALADQRELDDQNARAFERANPVEGLMP
ncbi:MAG TPA: flagellar export protein FliJ [Candidatus Baltobacteraceae bacterium]|nr:flagellar export protein FliJ [Candidatus Baltobacteraceae bacterium]